jgi:DNA-binding XRE family transcriptional regulator
MARIRPSNPFPRAYAQHSAHNPPAWAAALRGRRLELGLTQAAVADLAAVSRRTVVALEQGRTTVALGTALAVLGVLGLGLHIERGDGGQIRADA